MNGSATRREAKEFWEMVQEMNAAKPPGRQILPGTSCGNCGYFSKLRCSLKRKAVKTYNVCSEWKTK